MKFNFNIDLNTNNKLVNLYSRVALNAVIFLVAFGWLIPSLMSAGGPSFIFGLVVLLAIPLIFYRLNEKEADAILVKYFPEWFKDDEKMDNNSSN